ncbi:hypothetical protein ACQP2Y_15080 [Actinoplanes sp. CA-051413]|uniref:hypothetical protein n=1 Tax=Actinoplanes sp. CA-051413 TaxID=3239899 RepID=UPI003D964240
MRVTLGMKLAVALAVALTSLLWIAPGPADPPHPESAIVLVIEQPAPVDDLCPRV